MGGNELAYSGQSSLSTENGSSTVSCGLLKASIRNIPARTVLFCFHSLNILAISFSSILCFKLFAVAAFFYVKICFGIFVCLYVSLIIIVHKCRKQAIRS